MSELKDIPEMSVEQHHKLCIGVLAMCYKHVPWELKRAIRDGCLAAKDMGMQINPDNLGTDKPLHEFGNG